MSKLVVTGTNNMEFEVEAETFEDGGHEGRWIDFGSRNVHQWHPVLRIRAVDVRKIERKD